MNEKKKEIRTLEGQLAIREQASGEAGESRTICGRAIVFNSESELLDDFGMRFREVILPSAVTEDFLMQSDIKMNLLHDRNQTVARWNKGKGSLRLSLSPEGLDFEFEAPRCDLGDRCLEMVRRGDYSGCSFEFYVDQYDVEEREKNDVLIKHKSFAKLSALTIGLDPAYTATTVNVRELIKDESEEEEKRKADEERLREEERLRQEAEEREKREKEAVAVASARRQLVNLMNTDNDIYV